MTSVVRAAVLLAACLVQPSSTGWDVAPNIFYNYMDEMAEATCTALSPSCGWSFAVRRKCFSESKESCAQICASPSLRAQDQQVARKPMSCVNTLHVYGHRPLLDRDYTKDTNKLGLKILKHGASSCGWTGCGPNYCCCFTFC